MANPVLGNELDVSRRSWSRSRICSVSSSPSRSSRDPSSKTLLPPVSRMLVALRGRAELARVGVAGDSWKPCRLGAAGSGVGGGVADGLTSQSSQSPVINSESVRPGRLPGLGCRLTAGEATLLSSSCKERQKIGTRAVKYLCPKMICYDLLAMDTGRPMPHS